MMKKVIKKSELSSVYVPGVVAVGTPFYNPPEFKPAVSEVGGGQAPQARRSTNYPST